MRIDLPEFRLAIIINALIDKMSEINKGKTKQSDNPYNILLILDDMASDMSMHLQLNIL